MDVSTSRYYFRTRDLVTIGVLSALSGAFSTYIGYLGQLLNAAIGVPFGAGQFLSGLHVFWIVIAAGLVRKPGTASLTGLLKGLVEFLTGSTHGLVVVLVSFIQGLIVDAGLSVTHHRDSLPLYCIVGGFSAASNVIVFQLLYFSGVPLLFLSLMVVLAFSSGIIFGGYFANATVDLLLTTNMVRISPRISHPKERRMSRRRTFTPNRLAAVVFLVVLAFGAGLYTVFAWRPLVNPFTCDVMGQVASPYRFTYAAFVEHEVTIEAELVGSITYIPTRNYTGVPLSVILTEAQPLEGANVLTVIASDGYSATFPLHAVLDDDGIILIIDNGLRIVAKHYPGQYWVEKVVSLVIN